MIIHTVQLSRSRGLDVPVVDVTVKSASGEARFVAPTWDMVMGYKRGIISEEEYTLLYEDILECNERRILDFFSTYDKVALACYCRPAAFCHRVLLAEWLVKKSGASYIGELSVC